MSDNNVDFSYKGMNDVFKIAAGVLNEMKDGEKMYRTDFHEKVCAQTGDMPKTSVIALISMFLRDRNDVVVERGRTGGIYKGSKPKRVDPRLRCGTCNQIIRTKENKNEEISII